MASPEKLLLEAEYAFRNITPGSIDEKKFTAAAKRYASRLVRKCPASQEFEQAHGILRRLGVGHSAVKPRSGPRPRPGQPFSPRPHADHTPQAPHRHSAEQREAIAKVLARTKKRLGRGARATQDDSWKNIWRIFLGLSYSEKKILTFLSIFLFAIIAFTPFLLVFFLYYAAQPASIRKHLHRIVTYFA